MIDPTLNRTALYALVRLGSLAEQEGKLTEASEYYRQALAVSRRLAKEPIYESYHTRPGRR